MHAHRRQSKTYRMEEPPALEEVKHPHRDRTSVSRSPSTEQEVLSQFSGFSEEIGHFTRDPYTTHLKSCTQSTDYAFRGQEVHTCINCEHSHGHMNDQNTPVSLGKQFLQGKERSTCTDMEGTPALQDNETNMDTCTCICQGTFTPGSTTPSKHSMISMYTHPGIVPQNSQQLEKESSNTVALPGFKHSADTATHTEASRNVHSLQTYTNIHANMDTNHTAHRDRDARKEAHLLSGPSELRPFKAMAHRHARKEAHLLSGPSELRPFKAMAHRHARKEAHLLSGPSELRPFKAMAHRHTREEAHLLSRPSELQPTEHPETQKLDSAHVQQTRQEYSRLTETEKAKFQNPFIYNDDRNFVRHNSVNKISPNLVFMTTQNTSLSNSVFCRKKGRKRGRRRTAEIAL